MPFGTMGRGFGKLGSSSRRNSSSNPNNLANFQAVATLGLPFNNISGGQGSDGIRMTTGSTHVTGPSTISAIRVMFTDLFGTNFSASGFNTTRKTSLYIAGAPTPGPIVFTWSGSQSVSVPSGTVAVISDPILPSQFGLSVFPANTAIVVISQEDFLGASQQFAYGMIGNDGNFGANVQVGTTNFTNQITTYPFGIGQPQCRTPLAILGIPTTPHVSAFFHGDSLANSYNPANGDTPAFGHKGWIARATDSVNGKAMPFTNLAIDGNASNSGGAGSVNGLALIGALAPYFTHFLSNFGHNGAGSSTTQMADMTTIWQKLKNTAGSKIRHIEHVKIIPQTSSTNNWIDQAGQTPAAGFEPNGTSYKDTFNLALDTAVGGGLLDATYKHTSIEPVLGFWKTDGNPNTYVGTDGTHPKSPAYALMGPDFNVRLATWT